MHIHTHADIFTYQNNILNMLATSRVKHTYVENPSAFSVLRMSMYWGINGTIPPKIMHADATHETRLVNVRSTAGICNFKSKLGKASATLLSMMQDLIQRKKINM